MPDTTKATTKATTQDKSFALVAHYGSPAALYHACEQLRDAGYKKIDAHTPFPVHGLEKALGVGPSRVPWIVLVCGIIGFGLAVLMQWWMSAVDYPMIIAGKPFFAWQAYVPITFELTILLSAFGAFFGMWGLNALPRFYHPVFKHPSFYRASDDLFFLAVETGDPKYNPQTTRKLLEQTGAREIVEVMS